VQPLTQVMVHPALCTVRILLCAPYPCLVCWHAGVFVCNPHMYVCTVFVQGGTCDKQPACCHMGVWCSTLVVWCSTLVDWSPAITPMVGASVLFLHG
jgi:hypothetical protein